MFGRVGERRGQRYQRATGWARKWVGSWRQRRSPGWGLSAEARVGALAPEPESWLHRRSPGLGLSAGTWVMASAPKAGFGPRRRNLDWGPSAGTWVMASAPEPGSWLRRRNSGWRFSSGTRLALLGRNLGRGFGTGTRVGASAPEFRLTPQRRNSGWQFGAGTDARRRLREGPKTTVGVRARVPARSMPASTVPRLRRSSGAPESARQDYASHRRPGRDQQCHGCHG